MPKRHPELTLAHVEQQTAERGWFQRQLWAMDMVCHGRWTYWLGICMQNDIGDLPDWAIPQINFDSPMSNNQQPAFSTSRPWGMDDDRPASLLKELGTRSECAAHVLRVFERCLTAGAHLRDLIDWWLWAFGDLSVQSKPQLPVEAELIQYGEFQLHRLLGHPADWCGYVAQDYYSHRAKQRTGWFATPTCVTTLMNSMVFLDAAREGADTRGMSMNEPCCGTGIILLTASNYSLDLSGQDIDPLMVSMTRFHGWLYAPWMVYGNKSLIRGLGRPRRTLSESAELVAAVNTFFDDQEAEGEASGPVAVASEPESVVDLEHGSQSACESTETQPTQTEPEPHGSNLAIQRELFFRGVDDASSY